MILKGSVVGCERAFENGNMVLQGDNGAFEN